MCAGAWLTCQCCHCEARRQLRAAFPEGKDCHNDIMGIDLPAYRPSTGESMRTRKYERIRMYND